jgi:hypothetical protein
MSERVHLLLCANWCCAAGVFALLGAAPNWWVAAGMILSGMGGLIKAAVLWGLQKPSAE